MKMNVLPVEILVNIFRHLDGRTKGISEVRLVCKQWKNILDEHFFKFNVVLTDHTVNYIRNLDGLSVDTLTVGDFIGEIPGDSGTLSRNKLALFPRSLVFESKNSQSCMLTQSPSVSAINMSKMLALNRTIENLAFQKNSLKFIKNLSIRGLYLQNLKSLEITLGDELSFDEETALLEIANFKTPFLTSLAIDSTKVSLIYDEDEIFRHYLRQFQFLTKIKAPLKTFEFRQFFRLLSTHQSPLTLDLPLAPEKMELLKLDLAKIQLKEFSFSFSRHEGSEPYNLGFHLLSCQNSLTKLVVNVPIGGQNGERLYSEVEKAVARNRDTLTQFSMHRLIFMTEIDELEPILQTLSYCRHLEMLTIFLYTIPNFPAPLPSSIKSLALLGDLSPNLLLEIKASLPRLEYLEFSVMSPVSQRIRQALISNLKRLLSTMTKLKMVKWYADGLNMDSVFNQEPRVTLKRIHPSLFIYMIKRI